MIDVAYSVADSSTERLEGLIAGLDDRRGVVLSSGIEYPGRYNRFDMGFIDPPLVVETVGDDITLTALNERGSVPLAGFRAALLELPFISLLEDGAGRAVLHVTRESGVEFSEEERTKRPSLFSVLRALRDALPSDVPQLGLYGSFGYDLIRQIEDLPLPAHQAQDAARELVLYLADRILVIDRQRDTAVEYAYEFSFGGASTEGIAPTPVVDPFVAAPADAAPSRDHAEGEYAALVEEAKAYFARGDLFEVVPSQVFSRPVRRAPSTIFDHLRLHNPAPYGAFMNLGGNEFLVAISPEMYVRVGGTLVETCPISGTVARGKDPLEDADQILTLLSSDKDRSELTMCTDVDRNDKSRICDPDTVRIIGRRQIELYSRVIHTVDHVVGTLREGFDGLDAFASHMWAVTVTGAPKLWAMRFIDEHERTRRRWYGGAMGVLYANGDINTGLTLRTMQLRDGYAHVRAGGTLLNDSTPADEERETELKASALLDALEPATAAADQGPGPAKRPSRVLLFDHEDSFVHTLSGYFRSTGASVHTVRVPQGGLGAEVERIVADFDPDLVVLSPGPGSPQSFDTAGTIKQLLAAEVPIFGVCLGHQALGEFFGARLGQLDDPLHGKERLTRVVGGGFLDDVPTEFTAGRYHSLYVDAASLPEELLLVATDDDGVTMAMQHGTRPIWSVQFHPESIMTRKGGAGHAIVSAVVDRALAASAARRA